MKNTIRLVVLGSLLCGGSAFGITITPSFTLIVPDPLTNVNDNSATALADLINLNTVGFGPVTAADVGVLLFKENEPSGGPTDDGALKLNYAITIALGSTDSFTITWLGGAVAHPSFLVVKDGDKGGTFVFDLSTWDGQETITGTGFYPDQGNISHVSVWGQVAVPDSGLTAIMLGAGVLGLGWMARRK